jgi:hypothetical protein
MTCWWSISAARGISHVTLLIGDCGLQVPDDVLVEYLGGPRQVKAFALDRLLGTVLPEV